MQESSAPQLHKGVMLIPGAVLLGLGIGLLIGHPESGVLAGLGLGLITVACTSLTTDGSNSIRSDYQHTVTTFGILAIVGLALIFLGAVIVMSPYFIWPQFFAIVIIILGIGFLYKSINQRK